MKIQIGSISAEPGTRKYEALKVAERLDGTSISLPVVVVNGSEEGPVISVDGCHHGNEYEGALAIVKLGQTLDPKNLKGTFLGVPAVNVPAFEAGMRGNPMDFDTGHLDANRIYPGRLGSITERLVYTYLNEVLSKADCAISIHGGGDLWMCGPIVIYQSRESGKEVFEKSLGMAKSFGIDLLCPTPKAVFGTLLNETAKRGIPAISPEVGGHCDRYLHREHYVDLAAKGVTNVMKHLGMLEGKPDAPTKQTFIEAIYLHCQNGGIQFPHVKSGDHVKEGTTLIEIVNPWTGEEVERIVAPYDGIIWLVMAYPRVNPGDWVCGIGRIMNQP